MLGYSILHMSIFITSRCAYDRVMHIGHDNRSVYSLRSNELPHLGQEQNCVVWLATSLLVLVAGIV